MYDHFIITSGHLLHWPITILYVCVCVCWFTSSHISHENRQSIKKNQIKPKKNHKSLERILRKKKKWRSERRWVDILMMGHSRDGRWADLIELIQWPCGRQFEIVQHFKWTDGEMVVVAVTHYWASLNTVGWMDGWTIEAGFVGQLRWTGILVIVPLLRCFNGDDGFTMYCCTVVLLSAGQLRILYGPGPLIHPFR